MWLISNLMNNLRTRLEVFLEHQDEKIRILELEIDDLERRIKENEEKIKETESKRSID